MENLRARPTLRLLSEDLKGDGRFGYLVENLRENPSASQSICDLDHPIIRKAVQCFGDDPSCDKHDGVIKAASRYTVYKIRESQWRGGVWKDADGVNWLIIAGLSKGGHHDHDDIYARVKHFHKSKESADRLKPQPEDFKILKVENAVKGLHAWKLHVQANTRDAFKKALDCGSASFDIVFPPTFRKKLSGSDVLSGVTVSVGNSDDEQCLEVEVLFTTDEQWRGTEKFTELKIQVLNSILPPLHEWDPITDYRFYSLNDNETWKQRLDSLDVAVEKGVLQPSVLDPHSHYLHRDDIAESTANGSARRALCGSYVVSHRDPDKLPTCPECNKLFGQTSTGTP